MYLIFDTETTGLPLNFDAPTTDLENWPRLVQLAWQLHNNTGKLLSNANYIIKPSGFTIPYNSERIHGISTEKALLEGYSLIMVLEEFKEDVQKTQYLVGHNTSFDIKTVAAEFLRNKQKDILEGILSIDTKEVSIEYCALPGGKGGKFKWPTLTELHTKLFNKPFESAHEASHDVDATAKCFFALMQEKIISPLDEISLEEIEYESPELIKIHSPTSEKRKHTIEYFKTQKYNTLIPFSHLHVHSHYSILQSTAALTTNFREDAPKSQQNSILEAARKNHMRAVAITDHGNLHASFDAVMQQNSDLKVIIGCEFYVAKEHRKHKFTKEEPDRVFHQVLLAKNQQGYTNLSKLSSIGFIEGYYNQIPRISKEFILQYRENLIATTGNLEGEIPQLILNKGDQDAEEAFQWWYSLFGKDFYIALMRHGLEEENRVNEVLLHFSKKYGVKPIATNNVYYIQKTDSHTHEILWCIKEAKQMSMPVGKGRRYRYALPNSEYYFKTQEEMNALFADLPEALMNTNEIIDKCEILDLKRNILLPAFSIPSNFRTQDDYLKFLAYEGVKRKYTKNHEKPKELLIERMEYELDIIKKMNFPGYFLIIQDLIQAAKKMGVLVGPGRGSVAGSVIAYCIGITNLDPIKYNLLFERFLNPARISMPDIDIDFDDRGRQKIIDYVIKKYGRSQVAQIINYSTLTAKVSIKDVARVLELPLASSNTLAKMIPDTLGITLQKVLRKLYKFSQIEKKENSLEAKVLKIAQNVEGCIRGTGIHAAGIIIAPNDLIEYIPVCIAKDTDLLVTQFDGKIVEKTGMLKMDFLGLKTLTVIKDTLVAIEKNHHKKIDINAISLDDPKTFELYCQGKTVGTFQFESQGMRAYLQDLKPNNIEDLIAMNALYRPGPIQFIPNFIRRKHGKEPISYLHPLLEPILSYSYGIVIYQEQIMQIAQVLAGYTLGDADLLRQAMGKKKREEMINHRNIFVRGALKKNKIPKEKAEEIFDVMEKFAEYGFNRSHSTVYSLIAYQTAYLKVHYTAEYMSALLSNWLSHIEKIRLFIEECKAMKVSIVGPDINESAVYFNTDKKGVIRFGLAAIKGVGEMAVKAIVRERNENGNFKSVWNFIERIDQKLISKKTIENLALSGALDNFKNVHRAQYLHSAGNMTGIDRLLKYAVKHKSEKISAQIGLFSGSKKGADSSNDMINLPYCDPWSNDEKLKYEKETIGFYISGHPLSPYKDILKRSCVSTQNISNFNGKRAVLGGIITQIEMKQTKKGDTYARFTLEDHKGSVYGISFSKNYEIYKQLLTQNNLVLVEGMVKEYYKQERQWEVYVEKIFPLSQKSSDSVEIQIDIQSINSHMIKRLEQKIENNIGNYILKFKIIDKNQNIFLHLFSKKFRVDKSLEKIKI